MTLDTPPTSPFARPPEPLKQVAPQARPPASRPPRHLSTVQFRALIGGIVVVSITAGWLWNEFQNTPRLEVPVSTVVSKPGVSETNRKAAQEPAQALKALQSVTRIGVTYNDYQPRLAEATIQVDRYRARSQHDAEVGRLLERAAAYYVIANRAWEINIRGRSMKRERIQEVFQALWKVDCPPVRTLAGRLDVSMWGNPAFQQDQFGPLVSTIWGCASETIKDLDELLSRR